MKVGNSRIKAVAVTHLPYRMDWSLGSRGMLVFDKKTGGIKVSFNLTYSQAKDLQAILNAAIENLESHLEKPAHPTKKEILAREKKPQEER